MKNDEALESIKEIREMMNRSSKCLSLSGISGVFIGCYALLGAYSIHYILLEMTALHTTERKIYVAAIAIVILLISVLTAVILSKRKARKKGDSIFSATAIKIHKTLFTGLLPGGILSIAMGISDHSQYITTVMLLFYGLAMVNASHYTYRDIRFLGYSFLATGFVNCFLTEYSLEIWCLGFGLLHIIYGIVMYFKYEKAVE
ncbi:hypothetical protein [Parabacteroides sp. FAFU027]|uniref:hypothetical protein n=1 Tax=Parabacteroides sp. FAFU027 TaxID=2922715 RepID=UPI001FAF87B8|nr:hypothetical protein [Parabacteroides sp. FAFU027]